MEIEIKKATEVDIPLLYRIFEKSVTGLCRQDYEAEQIQAWVSRADVSRWQELFKSDLCFWLAIDKVSRLPVGFTSINRDGYLHSLFVHPDYIRQGIATMLLVHAETWVSRFHVSSVYAEVSLTARPFFEKQGYKAEQEQCVVVNEVPMCNFVMRKLLGCCNSF